MIDTVTAMTALPVFDMTAWDPAVAAEAGTTVDRLPRIVPGDAAAGRVLDGSPAAGALLGGGTVDAFAEQLVAGADDDGDVLVICGTTLITWAVMPEWREVARAVDRPAQRAGQGPRRRAEQRGWPVPRAGAAPDRRRTGRCRRRPAARRSRPGAGVGARTSGASARRCTTRPDGPRSHDLDLTHDAVAVRRAAYEAAGFVVRHHLDLAGVDARRIVATGGGVAVGGVGAGARRRHRAAGRRGRRARGRAPSAPPSRPG